MATTRVGVRTATRSALAVYAASLSLPALSLGLGDIEMQSFLNEPLQAQVQLLDVRDLNPEDIRIRLARIEDFDRLGVDRSYFLTSIEFDVSVDPATGRGLIRLSTPNAVLEPYLDLIIEARWPQGRVLREYTVLVDPPAFREETITVSASERIDDPQPAKPAVADGSGAAVRDTGDTQGTGDAVALRPGNLPPGEMPDRAFSAETAPTPRAGSRYMVKRDETLWQIASAGRPDDVSVQQAMLDIQRLNPEAFIDGNINRIKAGYIVYLPAAGEVSSDDLAAALDEVRAQNRAFAEGRTPGVSAAASLRVSADTEAVVDSEGTDERPVAVAPAVPPEPDAAQGSTDDSAPGVTPMVPDEDPGERVTGVDTDLAAQLAAMGERLDTLEQIVALKDEQIATLEQALREAREAADTAPAAVAPAPATPSRTPAATPPPASAAPSVPWLPIGGAAIAVLLAIALFLRRRSSRDAALAEGPAASGAVDEADVFKGVSLKSDALADAAGGAQTAAASADPAPVDRATDRDDLELNRGGSRGYGERKNDDYIDDGAAGDALAEADIYIAYGRYLQAIELLDTAIENEPDNSAYRLKLTELYVDMGEDEKAAAQLEALREQGNADAIARGEALLGGGAPASPEPEPGPGPATASPAAEEASGRAAADDASHEGDAPDEEADAEAPASAVPAGELDLDLDVGEPDLHLDLETESELPASIDSHELPGQLAPEAVAIDDAVADATGEPMEFDQLEIEEDSPGVRGDSDTLDLGDADEPDEILDLTDALGEFSSARLDEPADQADPSEEGEDLLIADDVDQMATKLDLARAYVDMGDSDGARGILEEVAAAASGEVQQEARDLLERIS